MDVISGSIEKAARPRAVAVAHAWLLEPTYKHLQAAAHRRGVHVDALAAEIITAALLTKAVDRLILDAEKLLTG